MDVLLATGIDQSNHQQSDSLRRPRRRLISAAAGIASLLLAAGCSGSEKPKLPPATEPTTAAARPNEAPYPFKVTRDWASLLPGRVIPQPQFLPADRCLTQGLWKPDNPQPIVSSDPLIVRADGRCNGDVTSEAMGVYRVPRLTGQGPAPIGVLNGDALGVECKWETGESLRDNSGESTRSAVWVGVAARNRKAGDQIDYGYVSVVNLGFPATSGVELCEAA